VADELGVAPEAVTVRHGGTHGAPQGMGTFGSRSTALGGSALALAARDVPEKARKLAAGMLEAAAQDVVAVDGGFGVVGAPGRHVTWARVAEVAYRGQGLPPGTEPGLEATRFFSPEGEVWSAGAFVVSVRIDRDTGSVTPERIVWLDDAGTIVNPLLADGQLEGSLAQGWGQVMLEDAILDRDGHLLAGTLMDYAVPLASPRHPGPAYMPVALAIVLICLGALSGRVCRQGAGAGERGLTEWPHAVAIFLVCAFAALALERIGFRLTIALSLAFLLR